jgi:uncharacterized protein with FMN-binding domain
MLADIDETTVPSPFSNAFTDMKTIVMDYERINDVRIKEETVLDESDSIIGFKYTGFKDGNSANANEISVEVDSGGTITAVELLNHYDTPSYVSDYIEANLANFVGETLDTIYEVDASADDAFAGATNTGESIVSLMTAALEYHGKRAEYAEIYPDMVDYERTFVQGFSTIKSRISILDESGSEIGALYEGFHYNSMGSVSVHVGIKEGSIVKVTIPAHNNTAGYVNNLVETYLPNLNGQSTSDITYDAKTGATITYESIQDIINEAVQCENERGDE